MTKNNCQTAGVTLIETLVAVGLVLVIALSLLSVYGIYGKLYGLGQAQFSTLGGARSALTEVTNYTAQAYRVVASRIINGGNYVSGASTLILQLPAVDAAGKTINNTWDYVVFYASSSNFYRYAEVNALSARMGGQKLLTSSLNSLNFSYDSVDFTQVKKVTLDLSTRASQNHVPVVNQVTGQVMLKNY